MKPVLITGATGFLGQRIARYFARRGWQIIGVGSSPALAKSHAILTRYFTWRLPDSRVADLLSELRPLALIHCAGSASVAESIADPRADRAAGPELVAALLEQLRRFAPMCRFLNVSSAAVSGNPVSLPITEEASPSPISPYGLHKWQAEQLCAEFARRHGLRTTSVRIFSAYGSGLRRQVLWDSCRKLTAESRPTFQGTGSESRDFIHVADIARAIYRVCRFATTAGEVYNVATGRENTIADVIERIAFCLAPRKRVRFDGRLPPGVPGNWRADIGKLADLGFQPHIGLEAGLANYVAWFRREAACAPSLALA
jgi:UDP-glucose 4-epimerase